MTPRPHLHLHPPKPFRPNYLNRCRSGHLGGLLVLGALLIVVFYILYSISVSPELQRTHTRPIITTGFNYSVSGIKDFVTLCLNWSTQQTLIEYGRKGALLDKQFLPQSKTTLVLDGGKANSFPSEHEMEKQLAAAINHTMQDCIADFSPFTKRGFVVSTDGAPDLKISLTPQDIQVFYTSRFTIQKETLQASYQRFSYEIHIRLPGMIDQAHTMIEFAQQRPEDADLSTLVDSDYETVFFAMDNATIVVLRDMDHHIKEAPYEFWFAIK